jgi:hypothetical protein
MCNQHWLIVYQPPIHSICGCQKKCMTSSLWSSILSLATRVINTSDITMTHKLQELLVRFGLIKM